MSPHFRPAAFPSRRISVVAISVRRGLSSSTIVQRGPNGPQSQIMKSGIQEPPSGLGRLARGNTHERWGATIPSNKIAGLRSKNCWSGFSSSAFSSASRNSSTSSVVHSRYRTQATPRIVSGGWRKFTTKAYSIPRSREITKFANDPKVEIPPIPLRLQYL
jgi:hypothetical protein